MAANAASLPDTIAPAMLALFQQYLANCDRSDFAIRLWEGSTWTPQPATRPSVTLVIRHPGVLRNLFSGDEVRLAEAYLYGGLDLEGNVEAIFVLADALIARGSTLSQKFRAAKLMSHLPSWEPQGGGHARRYRGVGSLHSIDRDRRAVSHHYDISNEFYKLWLDQRMVYSCAYFISPKDDLDSAQIQKLDYLCRKLRLQPGQHLLDIGCGWGGLVIHAAAKYGVNATGITVSRAQAELANECIHGLGLQDRCRVQLRDYREMEDWNSYDSLVSVGMFEHVGEAMLPDYFTRAFRLLRPGGRFLNHGIARGGTTPVPKRPNFVSEYVFPDGELVKLSTTLHIAEQSGFEIRDVESLREHYVLTLRHWIHRLEANAQQAIRMTDEVTYRLWRLYMSGSAYWFDTARNNIYQSLLVKQVHGRSGLPLTRADWYV